jgi:hypothetical protein
MAKNDSDSDSGVMVEHMSCEKDKKIIQYY